MRSKRFKILIFIFVLFPILIFVFIKARRFFSEPVFDTQGMGEVKPVIKVDKETGLASYLSLNGKFIFSYPVELDIHVDYVRVKNTSTYHPVKNVVELDSSKLNLAPYVLVQFSKSINPIQLADYISNSSECESVSASGGESIPIGGVIGKIYKNISCNSRGETRIYFVNGNFVYNISINEPNVDEKLLAILIANFKFIED